MMICGGHADEKQIFSKYHWKNHIVTGIFYIFLHIIYMRINKKHYLCSNKGAFGRQYGCFCIAIWALLGGNKGAFALQDEPDGEPSGKAKAGGKSKRSRKAKAARKRQKR